MKRLVSLLLILVMCLCTVNLAVAEAPTELTIAVVRRAADRTETFNEKQWVKDAEEALNLKLNFVELIEGAVDEPLAALLAGDLPDVFFMGLQLVENIVTQNAGLFRPITEEELKTYAPTYYSLCENHVNGWREYMTYPDGNMYGMMSGTLSSEMHLTQGLFFINTAWLEKLDLEVPTTMDEFYNVLVAFRDQDPNGNGLKDEIPIDFGNSHWTSHILKFAGSWGMAMDQETFYDVENGSAVGTVNTPEFREFLEYYHKLGQEGLFNLEGFSQTNDQFVANCDAMRVGMFWQWGPWSAIKSDANAVKDYQVMLLPAVEGQQFKVKPNQPNRTARNGWVISKDCKNWEKAMELYDYWCDPARALTVANGAEGIGWEWLDEATMQYTTPTEPNPETQPEAYAAWEEKAKAAGYEMYFGQKYTGDTIGYLNNSPLRINTATYDMSVEPLSNNAIRILAMRVYTEADAIGECIPKTIVPAEAQEELDFMTDGLAELITGFTAESIINGVTDESWNAFQTNLEKYNYSFYVDWYNKLCHNEL